MASLHGLLSAKRRLVRVLNGRMGPSTRRPPRIRACVALRAVAIGFVVFFLANLAVLFTQLDQQDPNTHPQGYPLQKLRIGSNKERTIRVHASSSASQTKGGNPNDREVDLLPEREVSADEYADRIKQLEKEYGGTSCRRRRPKSPEVTINGDYCPNNKSLTYYNPLGRERILCDGTTIQSNSKVTLQSKCNEPSRLFSVIPDRSGQGMPPVRMGFKGYTDRHAEKTFPCDIPCIDSGSPQIVTTRYVESIDGGSDWQLIFSMEGEAYYKNLAINPTAYKHNRFYSTTSYRSEIPLPYFSWSEYNIQGPAVNFDTAIKGAAFLARNCDSNNNREEIVRQLQASSFRIDSLSSCLHNAEPPAGVNLGDKKDVMKHYLFYLAFENQCTEDYITEKLWGPFESGTVPVYYGSPNIKEHVPKDSVIVVEDFATTADLADYLQKVANNKALYEKHQAWRLEPLPPPFHAKYDFTEVHSTCRTCRWAYSRFYGLGWNHGNQSLRELETPREPCVQPESGLLEKPVVEKWLPGPREAQQVLQTRSTSSFGCNVDVSIMKIDNRSLRRTLRAQDGAIDFWIEQDGESEAVASTVLLLEAPFPLSNEDIDLKLVMTGHVRLQNNRTRYSVLTWPRLSVKLRKNEDGGVIEIPVEASSLPLRIRILVEDIDTFHKGAEQEENFFGKLMIEDFYNPIETFVDS